MYDDISTGNATVDHQAFNNRTKLAPIWCLEKKYTFADMNATRMEWIIQGFRSSKPIDDSRHWENCPCVPESIAIRNGNLVIRAYRIANNATYYSTTITSRMAFAPSNYPGANPFKKNYITIF